MQAEWHELQLRNALGDRLKRLGISNAFKAQMRAKFVAELLATQEWRPERLSLSALWKTVLDALLVDHFKKIGLEFTLSIYLPESGVSGNETLALNEVRQLLGLSENKDYVLARKLTHRVKEHGNQSFLLQLLQAISELNISTAHQSVQTESTDLEQLIAHYEEALQAEEKKLILAVQEVELKSHSETARSVEDQVDRRISLFRECELQKIKSEEQEKQHAKYELLKNQLQSEYEQQTHTLQQYHQTEMIRIESKEKKLDIAHTLRQHELQRQIDNIKLKEEALTRESVLHMQSLRIEEEMHKRNEQELLNQIRQLNDQKDEQAIRLQDQLKRHQLEFDQAHSELVTKLRIQQAKLDAETTVLAEKTKTINQSLQTIESTHTEVIHLRQQLQTRDQELIALKSERARQLDQTTQKNTDDIAAQLIALKRQMEMAEQLSQERQEEHRRLLSEALGTAGQKYNRELSKTKQSATKWQKECRGLLLRLDAEIIRNCEMQKRFDDEIIANKELVSELANLRLNTHQIQAIDVDWCDRVQRRPYTPRNMLTENLQSYEVSAIKPLPRNYTTRQNSDKWTPPRTPPQVMSDRRPIRYSPALSFEDLHQEPPPLQATREILSEPIDTRLLLSTSITNLNRDSTERENLMAKSQSSVDKWVPQTEHIFDVRERPRKQPEPFISNDKARKTFNEDQRLVSLLPEVPLNISINQDKVLSKHASMLEGTPPQLWPVPASTIVDNKPILATSTLPDIETVSVPPTHYNVATPPTLDWKTAILEKQRLIEESRQQDRERQLEAISREKDTLARVPSPPPDIVVEKLIPKETPTVLEVKKPDVLDLLAEDPILKQYMAKAKQNQTTVNVSDNKKPLELEPELVSEQQDASSMSLDAGGTEKSSDMSDAW